VNRFAEFLVCALIYLACIRARARELLMAALGRLGLSAHEAPPPPADRGATPA
jgi:hypothetical protein